MMQAWVLLVLTLNSSQQLPMPSKERCEEARAAVLRPDLLGVWRPRIDAVCVPQMAVDLNK